MKIVKNHALGSSGVLSTFLALGFCVYALSAVWGGSKNDNFEKTMHRAESFGYQILAAQAAIELGRAGKGRIPASEANLSRLGGDTGEIGLDNWGHPFRFRVIRKGSRQSKVFVWSLGPNGKAETSEENFDSSRDISAYEFGGDDVGVIVTIK